MAKILKTPTCWFKARMWVPLALRSQSLPYCACSQPLTQWITSSSEGPLFISLPGLRVSFLPQCHCFIVYFADCPFLPNLLYQGVWGLVPGLFSVAMFTPSSGLDDWLFLFSLDLAAEIQNCISTFLLGFFSWVPGGISRVTCLKPSSWSSQQTCSSYFLLVSVKGNSTFSFALTKNVGSLLIPLLQS